MEQTGQKGRGNLVQSASGRKNVFFFRLVYFPQRIWDQRKATPFYTAEFRIYLEVLELFEVSKPFVLQIACE